MQALKPYVPGEQPKIPGLIKINTNENPYPPASAVLDAVKAAVDGRLRLYPNATSDPLREKLAKLHGCSVDNIIVGNGSDELLALAVRVFTEPASLDKDATLMPQNKVQFLSPCYSLYPVLAEIHGSTVISVPLKTNFTIPSVQELRGTLAWDFSAGLTFVTTPNAPTGTACPTAVLEALCQAQDGVVVLDEAYVDFAADNAMSLALKYSHVLVARTFSKAYSLCFQRVGYMVGHPKLIEALHKIKDSYNVNGLGQVAACATLDNMDYYRQQWAKIIATRERLSKALKELGFEVYPSQSNFIFVKPPTKTAKDWLDGLRQNKVLVRWFSIPEVKNYLRISIGSDFETDELIRVSRILLKA